MFGFQHLSAAFAGITVRTRLVAALTVLNVALAGALVFAPQAVNAQFVGDPCESGGGETWCECWHTDDFEPNYCAIAIDVTEAGCATEGPEFCTGW